MCAVAHRPWSVMANDRGGRKVAKVSFPSRRVTYIRRGDRFGGSLSRKIIVRSTKVVLR